VQRDAAVDAGPGRRDAGPDTRDAEPEDAASDAAPGRDAEPPRHDRDAEPPPGERDAETPQLDRDAETPTIPPKDCEPLGSAVLFVSNLSTATTSAMVRELFEAAGARVLRVGLNLNLEPAAYRDGDVSARVDICTRAEAIALLNKLQGESLGGRAILIGIAHGVLPLTSIDCTARFRVQRVDAPNPDIVGVTYLVRMYSDEHVNATGIVDSENYDRDAQATSRDFVQGEDAAYPSSPVVVLDYATPSASFIFALDRTAAERELTAHYVTAQDGGTGTVTALEVVSPTRCRDYTYTDAYPTDPVAPTQPTPPVVGPDEPPVQPAVENCLTPGKLPCDDNDACNGRRRCDPGNSRADANGCVQISEAVTCPQDAFCDVATGGCMTCEFFNDIDKDGQLRYECGGTDCDDFSATRFAGAPELCDGLDNNCNGTVDEGADQACAAPSGGIAACDTGRCTERCADPSQVPVDGACITPTMASPNKLRAAVFLPRRVSTCLIGDSCSQNDGSCLGLYDDQGALLHGFTRSSLQAVRSTDPRLETAANKQCVSFVFTDTELSEVRAQLELYRTNVLTWTAGDVELTLSEIELDSIDVGLTGYGDSLWIAPWDFEAVAISRLDFVPDFNFVIQPMRDPDQRLHILPAACGLSFAQDWGIAGAGFSWLPKTGATFWQECLSAQSIAHEWLHQVEGAYTGISGFVSDYPSDEQLPACGTSGLDPKRWFPSTHSCAIDPDYHLCGGSCEFDVEEHVLRAHWDPSLDFIANHCRDGRQDFNETGVDSGGHCAQVIVAP
jgi:hypothetical protein